MEANVMGVGEVFVEVPRKNRKCKAREKARFSRASEEVSFMIKELFRRHVSRNKRNIGFR